jgi:3-carboxy-cis,cis-muconate cycloisomerase
MPHKRNPVAAMTALAAAQRVPQRVAALLGAMAQEHERGLGNWQAELAEWPGLFGAAHSALKALADAAPELVVDERRMRANLDASHGLVFSQRVLLALVERGLGRDDAYRLVQRNALRAWDEERSFRSLLEQDAEVADRLGPDGIAAAFDLDDALKHTDVIFERLATLAHTREEGVPVG